MKRKRITSLVLAVLLCVLNVNLDMFYSYAEENEREMVYISAIVNGNAKRLPTVQNEDGVLFLSDKTLSEITVYQNEENAMLFQHDNASDASKYREVLINSEQKQANLVSFWNNQPIIKKTVVLPDLINYNDEWYFPLAEMLPLLNANAVVEDECLYVEDVTYSMSNIMPEFKIEDYMYNSYNENDLGFTSSEKVLSAYSYLYNTVLNFDLKRLTFTGRYLGKVDSYEEILTSYLAEDETYYEALKDEDEYALPLIDYLQSDDSERISTLIDAMAPAKELADSYYENSKMTFSDYESITSIAKIAEISDFAIDMYSIAAIYTDHVDDHYQMLKSVYAIGDTEKASFLKTVTDPSNVAANRVYATYSEDKVNMIAGIVCQQTEKALTGELQDIVLQQIAEKKGLGNGFLWSQLATCVAKEYFIATDFYVHKVASECENLGYYNRLMEQGYGQYSMYTNEYDLISHENIENMRLSAIFTLLASRSIYQALSNANEAIGNSGDIYQRKVDSINEVLKKLYLAKNCCLTDSEEYIDEKISTLNGSIESIQISNVSNEELYSGFEKSFFGSMANALNLCNAVYGYKVCDADCDGYYEMAFHASFSEDDSVRGTNVLFESINSPSVRYHLPPDSGAAWGGFIYDSSKTRLMYSNQKASVGDTYSIYSIYENGSWTTVSEYIRRFKSNHVVPEIVSCYWEGEKVTEDEFRAKEENLNSYEWVDSNEIFNMYFDLPMQHLSDEFEKFLSKYCDVKESIQYTDSDGKKISIISVRNIFSEYLEDIDYFNNTSGYVVEQNEMRDLMQSINTTCFVIDETELGTRIRCENFRDAVDFASENGKLIGIKNGISYYMNVSSENSAIDVCILSFGKQTTSIEEKKDLIEQQLEGIDSKTLNLYSDFFYETFDENYCYVYLTDFNHDQMKEMTVIERDSVVAEEATQVKVKIFQNYENQIEIIYDSTIENSHATEYGLFWIQKNHKDYLMRYQPYIGQGIGCFSSSVFSISGNAAKILDHIETEEFYIKGGIADELYDAEFEFVQRNRFEDFVGNYIPYAVTLSNFGWYTEMYGHSYEGVVKEPFTKSEPSSILKNNDKISVAELEQIAEELYLSNGHAVVSCYTYCDWEVDYDDTIPSEYEASYYRIKGCCSIQDVLEVIHQTFSSRYDDYNRGETSGDPQEEGVCAVTKCLSEERGLFKEVNGKVYVLCGDSPYYVSNASATYQRTEGDEVWFTMSTDRPNRTFTADFSMVYEDGIWKMGAATYARY